MNGVTIKRFFDERYPLDLAYEWDNVGLQIGTLNKELSGVLIALDLTKEVIEEAVNNDANLIIVHHPLIFKPLKDIKTDAYKGQMIERLIKKDIAVFVSHTNYDLGHNGMNETLSKKLGLKNVKILEYEDDAHGIGRIGDIDPTPLQEAVETVKKRLNMEYGRLITRKDQKTVKRIAISGGSGAHHMFEAKFKNADLYITGDVTYHQAHDMLQLGLTALDIGHHVEKHFASALKEELDAYGVKAPIYESAVDTNPFKLI